MIFFFNVHVQRLLLIKIERACVTRDLLGVGHPIALDVQVVLVDWRQIQETLGDGKVQLDQAQELGAAFPGSQNITLSNNQELSTCALF